MPLLAWSLHTRLLVANERSPFQEGSAVTSLQFPGRRCYARGYQVHVVMTCSGGLCTHTPQECSCWLIRRTTQIHLARLQGIEPSGPPSVACRERGLVIMCLRGVYCILARLPVATTST